MLSGFGFLKVTSNLLMYIHSQRYGHSAYCMTDESNRQSFIALSITSDVYKQKNFGSVVM